MSLLFFGFNIWKIEHLVKGDLRSKQCHLPKWFLLALLCQDLWGPRCQQTDPDTTSAAMEWLDKAGMHRPVSSCPRPQLENTMLFISPGPPTSYLLPLSFQGIPAPYSWFSSFYSLKIVMVLHFIPLSSPLYSALPPIQRNHRKIYILNLYKWFL